MSVCACIGPIGNCPCIRKSRGEKIEITETYIAQSVFNCLSDEDKNTINNLKMKALNLYLAGKQK